VLKVESSMALICWLKPQRNSAEDGNPVTVAGWTVAGAFRGFAMIGELPRKVIKSRVRSVFMMPSPVELSLDAQSL
jgi:hypothetical protein